MISNEAWPTAIAYGGAFDPPHEGHRLVLRKTAESFPQAALYLLPAKTPAGAYGAHKQPSASFEQRMEMCYLAFASELQDLALTIDPLEAHLPEPNYTVRTMEALQRRDPEQHWAILMGRDQLLRFAGWYQPQTLAALASLVIIDRDATEDLSPSLEELGRKLGLELEATGGSSWRWKGWSTGVFWLPGCVSPAASRLIRNNWGEAAQKGWLSPEVAQYIKRNTLYTRT